MFQSIRKKARHWQEAGIISSQQADDILFFERSRYRLTHMLIQVACVCVAMGVLALIGANWWFVTPGIKAASLFVMLFPLGGLAHYFYRHQLIKQFEMCMLLLYILSLGSFLNFATWYQLSFELHDILLLWVCLTFASTFWVRWPVTLLMWVTLALFALYSTVAAKMPTDHIKQINLILSTPFLTGVLAVFSPRHLRKYLTSFAMVIFVSIILALSFTQSLYIPGYFWVKGPWLGSALFLCVLKFLKELQAKELIVWGALLVLFNVLILMNYTFPISHIALYHFITASVAMICLVIAAWIAYLKESFFISKLLLCLCLLRAFVWYLQALGGLMFTGVGLIATGVALILITFVIKKSYHWLNFSHI